MEGGRMVTLSGKMGWVKWQNEFQIYMALLMNGPWTGEKSSQLKISLFLLHRPTWDQLVIWTYNFNYEF